MGATSKQGWYLFTFIVGFTLGPAGLLALGWPIALIGFGLMIVALAGFYSIKEPVMPGSAMVRSSHHAAPAGSRAAKSY